MDYCSLCRKACVVKDFWKIYIGLILSLLLKWTFYPQRHMTLSSADSCCQKTECLGFFFFFLWVPFFLVLESFKWIPLISKWYPNFAEIIFFVYLYIWFLFFISYKHFWVSQMHVYGLECEVYGSTMLIGPITGLLLWFCGVTFLVKIVICLMHCPTPQP